MADLGVLNFCFLFRGIYRWPWADRSSNGMPKRRLNGKACTPNEWKVTNLRLASGEFSLPKKPGSKSPWLMVSFILVKKMLKIYNFKWSEIKHGRTPFFLTLLRLALLNCLCWFSPFASHFSTSPKQMNQPIASLQLVGTTEVPCSFRTWEGLKSWDISCQDGCSSTPEN